MFNFSFPSSGKYCAVFFSCIFASFKPSVLCFSFTWSSENQSLVFVPPCFFSLSLWVFPLPQFCPVGMAGDFTPNWSSRRPLLRPLSCSTSGRRDLGCEWCFVYCFSKRGPSLSCSHLSQVPLRLCSTMPDCSCQVARFQARSVQHFPAKFSCFLTHKRILSYCPHYRRGLS